LSERRWTVGSNSIRSLNDHCSPAFPGIDLADKEFKALAGC
jgi:hypothetical protein